MPIPGFQILLKAFPRANDPLGYWGTWREEAVKHGLLPVYSDWECSFALTEDAQPVYWGDGERAEDAHPLTNERHRFVVFAVAAERFPELAALRPTRQPDDPTCPSCKGSGKVVVEGKTFDNFICECGGLGWYPKGTKLGPA